LKWVTQVISAFGHENILAIHPTTLMITKDKHLSKNGDCIIALGADKAAPELDSQFKEALRNSRAKILITIEVGDSKHQILASGHPDLNPSHPTDLVVRKSTFISNRTLAVCANTASNDLPRSFVTRLQNPTQHIKITLTVKS
jgi:hypothetical protein